MIFQQRVQALIHFLGNNDNKLASKNKTVATKSVQKQQYQQQTAANTPKRNYGCPKKKVQEKSSMPAASTSYKPKLYNLNAGELVITHSNYTDLQPHLNLMKNKDKNGKDIPGYKPIFTI